MSVPKSKRSKSSVEFEMIYFKLADSIDNTVERLSFRDNDILDRNRLIINIRSRTLVQLSDEVLYHIKIANSIYPVCMAEWEERRVSMGKAIGACYAILTNIQRLMVRLQIKDDRYTEDVKVVVRMINALKAWRKSDNKLKQNFENK